MISKKTITLILFLFIFSTITYSNSKEIESPPTSEIKLGKIGKITTKKKPVDKKIVYLMILGLIIPLGLGYYVIKKK